MIWVKSPEMEPGTRRAHYFAYCWNCQRDKFMPGIPLTLQLYVNPFIHTEPLCEGCARRCDPNFGAGSKLELIDRAIHITKGDERECEHKGPKCFYPLHSGEVVIACSWQCAAQMEEAKKGEWESFCERIGLESDG